MTIAALSRKQNVTRNVYLSGQSVPPGVYRNLFSGRELLQQGGRPLPRALDGTATIYVRLARPFSFTKSTRNR
jgi:hypothetical protein